MSEINVKKDAAPVKKERERHEFRIAVNGSIVLQRGFKVDNLNSVAYKSSELITAIDQCVDIIEADLKKKSNLYLQFCAPQVLETEDDIKPWLREHASYIQDPMYIVLNDSDKVFILNDGHLREYTEKPYPKSDFVGDSPYDNNTVLEFSLFDMGRKVVSKVLDISQFPNFIRYNIDITNSRNRYKQEGLFSPMEYAMCEYFNTTRESIVPEIVDILTDVLSYEDNEEYTTRVVYGKTRYDLNVYREYSKKLRQMERRLYYKTLAYNRRWS